MNTMSLRIEELIALPRDCSKCSLAGAIGSSMRRYVVVVQCLQWRRLQWRQCLMPQVKKCFMCFKKCNVIKINCPLTGFMIVQSFSFPTLVYLRTGFIIFRVLNAKLFSTFSHCSLGRASIHNLVSLTPLLQIWCLCVLSACTPLKVYLSLCNP